MHLLTQFQNRGEHGNLASTSIKNKQTNKQNSLMAKSNDWFMHKPIRLTCNAMNKWRLWMTYYSKTSKCIVYQNTIKTIQINKYRTFKFCTDMKWICTENTSLISNFLYSIAFCSKFFSLISMLAHWYSNSQ